MRSTILSRRHLLTLGSKLAAFVLIQGRPDKSATTLLMWPHREHRQRRLLRPQLQQPALLELQDQWHAAIAGSPFSTAISAIDLQTGELIDVNGDDPRHPGCVLNLFVIMRVVKDLQEGRYAEPEVGEDIAFTIRHSSATRGRDLLVKTGDGDVGRGIDKVNELIRSLELTRTLYDHAPGYEWESRHGQPNVTTAKEVARALGALWYDQVLGHEWTVYLVEKMTQVKPGLNYLLAAGVPADTGSRVAHKNGFLWHSRNRWVDNDVGLVWRVTPQVQYGYAISLFFQDVPVKYQNIWLGQRLAWLAWQAFARIYDH